MAVPTVLPLVRESYLALVRASVGTRMFQSYYAAVDGTRKDIMHGGDLSCAYFVSFILTGFTLIEHMHGVVDSTVRDMEKSGWVVMEVPEPGDVVVWSAKVYESGESHKHIGFYSGEGCAISNDSDTRVPKEHGLQLPGREVVAFYRYSSFSSPAQG